MDERRPPHRGNRDDAGPEPGLLGDVVLCPQVAAKQAETAGHTTADELDLLTVHGILHLLGYDHAEPEEDGRCSDLQNRLLQSWRSDARRRRGTPAYARPGSSVPVAAAIVYASWSPGSPR